MTRTEKNKMLRHRQKLEMDACCWTVYNAAYAYVTLKAAIHLNTFWIHASVVVAHFQEINI